MPLKNNTQQSTTSPSAPADSLRDEYLRQEKLFDRQTPILQRFLEIQARYVAEAFSGRAQRLRFSLPDRVVANEKGETYIVPESSRVIVAGKFNDRIAGRDVFVTLRQKLTELESSANQAISLSAGLIRYASAQYIIHNMLPAGRTVVYSVAEGDEIPSIPAKDLEPESAITAETDAITEEGSAENGRGTLQVPYVPAARRFYLPQWVAFDDKGKLLVNSVDEAEAHIASMQKFLNVLFAARSLAPCMVVDDEFEKKRFGMLGQLVNQGRALALHMTNSIISTIKARADAQTLNRGLGIRLPFFDDQDLRIEHHDFVVIPAGRIMFVPAFVVRAAQEEQAKVAQDTRLSTSTRRHLLSELSLLETSFTAAEI